MRGGWTWEIHFQKYFNIKKNNKLLKQRYWNTEWFRSLCPISEIHIFIFKTKMFNYNVRKKKTSVVNSLFVTWNFSKIKNNVTHRFVVIFLKKLYNDIYLKSVKKNMQKIKNFYNNFIPNSTMTVFFVYF